MEAFAAVPEAKAAPRPPKPAADSRPRQARKPTEVGLRVELLEGREAFGKLEKEWNAALAAGPRDEPMLRHEWLRAWLENFAPGATLRTFCVRVDGELQAALPLYERTDRGLDTCGLPLVTWAALANDHSQRGGFLLGARWTEALPELWKAIRDTSGWDRILVRDLPEAAAEWQLRELAEADAHPCGLWVSLLSPYLPLPAFDAKKPDAGYAALEAAVDGKFRANLRRRRRRLEERGKLTSRTLDGQNADELERGLAAFLQLEASGWKGEEGTAILLRPETVGFYTQLAKDAAKRKALALGLIELDGRPIAGHLSIVHAGRFFLLKVGYDEALRECSPGQQLAADAIREACKRGLREFDFLGPFMDWKGDWEPQLRKHAWLTIFRPTRQGRAIHAARHLVWPIARGLLERFRGQ